MASNRGEIEEERAAIVKHDSDIPCVWTEGFSRLHPEQPPGDVPPRRWLQFIDDVRRFLDCPFCPSAAALGWGPYDLFGCDRNRPFARIDQLGLLWLVHGGQVIALTTNTASIRTSNGSILTYRLRAENAPNRVLAWGLQ